MLLSSAVARAITARSSALRAQLFVKPGVALCPGGAGEFVAFCGGAEEYCAAVARVAGAYGVAD